MSLPGTLDVGVIIGRFQVPELHIGHKKLFDIVRNRHKRVLVLLAIPAWRGGTKNPLDYQSREQMIKTDYPDVNISYICDRQTDEEWSKDVDKSIRSLYPLEKIVLYGGREGFISHYTGEFPTIETLEDPTLDAQSGTDARNNAAALPRNSAAFRAGVIYGSYAMPSQVCMCIDGAVIDTSKGEPRLLLIRKPNEKKWRFPGGRLEPGDVSLGSAAVREVREETGIEVGDPIYIDSDGPLRDWRGVQAGIAIHSALFYMPYIYGAPHGNDDAEDAGWFDLKSLGQDDMEPCHKKFLLMLKFYLQKKGVLHAEESAATDRQLQTDTL